MADIRTYRAATMQEALDLVRHELGQDAVILHTRQYQTRRRFLPWSRPLDEVEITAGAGVNVRTKTRRARSRLPATGVPSLNKTAATPQRKQQQQVEASVALQTASAETKHAASERSARPAMKMDRNDTTPRSQFAPSTSIDSVTPDARSPECEPSDSSLLPPISSIAAAINADREQSQGLLAAADQPASSSASSLESRLATIERMLRKMERPTHSATEKEIPDELFHIYTDLIDADVEQALARDLIFRLNKNCAVEQFQDASVVKSLLTGMVETEIRCAGPIAPMVGRRKVVALVGATGVGKTTTIAKLAADFRLRESVKIGLVTVDTYRIAAVEQLRTYAEIIDLPMKVVTSPPEMRRALDELIGLDLVLIDTAGRSPRDELQIKELKSLLSVANVDEVHLVLSMSAGLKNLESTARKFSSVGTTSLIMTKLDESVGMGPLLSISNRTGLPISYLTTGQDVPDDIEPARPSRIARLVLGQEHLANGSSRHSHPGAR